jgi:hypothetical protein
MPFPRAPKSIRLGDGTEIPLDDAIEWAKLHPRWPEWCKSALKIAECCGQTGLSSEQAGRWLLSMGDLMELWGYAREIAGKIGAGTGRPNYQSEIWAEIKKRLPLRDEILEHIKVTRDADAKRAKGTARVKARRKPPQTNDERDGIVRRALRTLLKADKDDGVKLRNENEIRQPLKDHLKPFVPTSEQLRRLHKEVLEEPEFASYTQLEPGQHWPEKD